VITALLSKHNSGCHKATEKEDDHEMPGKGNDIWRGQQASDLAGRRRRRKCKTELDRNKYSVAYAALPATRYELKKTAYYIIEPLTASGLYVKQKSLKITKQYQVTKRKVNIELSCVCDNTMLNAIK